MQPLAVRDALLSLRIVSDGSEAPVPPARAASEVEVWRDRDGDVAAQGYTAEGHYWLHFAGFASFRFGRAPGAVTAIPAPTVSADAVRDCHRRLVLPLALQALGLEVVHASGVLVPEGVVAFCGLPRTGKSTIAYGLHRRGHALWADDSVALHGGPSVEAIPLPFGIRLRPPSVAFFRATGIGLPGRLPGPRLPHAGALPLAAVFLLTRDHHDDDTADPRARRLLPGEAFAGVLGHALCFGLGDRDRKRRMVEVYLSLARQVPVVEVGFPPRFEKLGTVLDTIEQSLGTVLAEASGVPSRAD